MLQYAAPCIPWCCERRTLTQLEDLLYYANSTELGCLSLARIETRHPEQHLSFHSGTCWSRSPGGSPYRKASRREALGTWIQKAARFRLSIVIDVHLNQNQTWSS